MVFLFVFISNKNRPVEVEITKAETRDIVKTTSLSGEVKAENQVDIAFATSGTIQSISVKLEDTINQTDVLASLNASSLYNTYLAQKSLYDKAKQQLETFMETYKDDPNTALINSDDIYWSKYNEYNNAIASAKATTDATLNNLSNAYIKSPINGVITKLNYKEGEYITAGTSLLQVTNLDTLYFSVTAAQEDIGQIKLNQEVKIELDTYPDIPLKGAVYYISAVPEKNSSGNSVYEIKIILTKTESPAIKLGMEGSATITLENKISRLSVDYSAITETGDTKFVFVNENGIAKKKEVKTDFEGDVFVEITEGLKEGENIILSPLSKVKDRKRVF